MAHRPKPAMAIVSGVCFVGAFIFFGTPLWFLVPPLLLVASAPLVVVIARRISARRLFEFCVIRVPEDKVVLGGVARVRLCLEPKRPVQIAGATLTFRTEEKAIYEAGTKRRTYQEEVHRWSTPIDVPPVLERSFERELRIPIPRHIPPTFVGNRNFLRSFCHVYLDIPGAPDVELEEEITVAPEVLRG